MQPIVWDFNQGKTRFKANGILKWMLDNDKLDLNEIARMDFSDEDRQQLAQLIGYSVAGYCELSYVDDAAYEAAQAAEKVFLETGLSPRASDSREDT